MEDTSYPSYIPADVITASKNVLSNWGGEVDSIARRLITRPCMEKVYRDIGKLLNGLPEATGPSGSKMTPWNYFFEIMVTMEGEHSWVSDTVKPARKELKKRMRRIRCSGGRLLADLKWVLGGSEKRILRFHNGRQYHGLSVPDEFDEYFEMVEKVIEAASTWDAKSAYDELAGLNGRAVFTKAAPEILYAQSVHDLLRHACEHGSYGFPAVEKFRLPYLLSYDNYARITRAALDLPDDLGLYGRPFSGEDLRLAKAFVSR